MSSHKRWLRWRTATVPAALLGGLALAPSAFAAGPAIYGGATSDHAAIVLRADPKAKQLKSAVITTDARCDDGTYLTLMINAKAVKAQPGFAPADDEIAMGRNGNSRFKGENLMGGSVGDQAAAMVTTVTGKLAKGRSSGTLSSEITLFDPNTSQETGHCATGRETWVASRSPGKIYAGATDQDAPIVLRVNTRKHRLDDLLFGWQADDCQPGGFVSENEHFGRFALKGGRWGATFSLNADMGDGMKLTFDYDLGGAMAKRTANGVLHVKATQHGADGTTQATCDSGRIAFSATTG